VDSRRNVPQLSTRHDDDGIKTAKIQNTTTFTQEIRNLDNPQKSLESIDTGITLELWIRNAA